MGRYAWIAVVPVIGFALAAAAQEGSISEETGPSANPGRPTVSTPATLTPKGYLQFETGFLSAWHSPEFSSQTNVNEVVKFAISKRLEFLVSSEPFARSRVAGANENADGGVSLGVQTVIYQGEGARPTIGASYFRSVYGGNAADLDVGSYTNSGLLLASSDVKKFHYDFNLFFNEQVEAPIRRGQFGQSLSVSHPIVGKVGLSGEVWHFTQPFLRGNAVGNLWALSYTATKTMVLDGGFDRGLTGTSTRWEIFAGFTYLLPHGLLHR